MHPVNLHEVINFVNSLLLALKLWFLMCMYSRGQKFEEKIYFAGTKELIMAAVNAKLKIACLSSEGIDGESF